jgi:hypothetical protein
MKRRLADDRIDAMTPRRPATRSVAATATAGLSEIESMPSPPARSANFR